MGTMVDASIVTDLLAALKAVLARYPQNATPNDLRLLYGDQIATPIIYARGLIATMEARQLEEGSFW